MLRILGRTTSINVRKALWCADELGIAYQREDWGLPVRDPNVPEFLALNPNAQVPVLIEDGFVLWESGAILRYLCDTRGGEIWPAEPRPRAIADQWLTWQATELNAQWGYAFHTLVRKTPGYGDEARVADSLKKWTAKMAILEARLGETGGHVAGDGFTIADIVVGLSVHRWYAMPLPMTEFPAVRRYYAQLRQRPAGAAWMSADFN